MRGVLLSLAAAIALVAAVAVLTASGTSPSGEAAGHPRVVSLLGIAQVQGEDVIVDVWAIVLRGQDERVVAEAALRSQGARPVSYVDLQSARYSTNDLVWDQFFDVDPFNDYVVQHYNPAGDPTGGHGEAALANSQTTWTEVGESSFAFQYGGMTSRCPSLVDECPGSQYFDGFNDVGWLPLGGETILGVTWYGFARDEADMVLNANVGWHAGSTGCTSQFGKYDAQTVLLHENGHAAGLGHSDVAEAAMYAYYGGAKCQLHQDDIDGISALYPGRGGSAPPTPTPTVAPTSTPSGEWTATPAPRPDPWCQRIPWLCEQPAPTSTPPPGRFGTPTATPTSRTDPWCQWAPWLCQQPTPTSTPPPGPFGTPTATPTSRTYAWCQFIPWLCQ